MLRGQKPLSSVPPWWQNAQLEGSIPPDTDVDGGTGHSVTRGPTYWVVRGHHFLSPDVSSISTILFISRMSYKWNCTVCNRLAFASFIQHNSLKSCSDGCTSASIVHSFLSRSTIPWNGWTTVLPFTQGRHLDCFHRVLQTKLLWTYVFISVG